MGTWIDGRKIYKKTQVFAVQKGSNVVTFDVTDAYQVIDYEGFFSCLETNESNTISWENNQGEYACYIFGLKPTTSGITFTSVVGSSMTEQRLYLTLYYTK